jgi:hypothetical protein
MRALAGVASRYSLMALSASGMAFGSPLAISLRRIPNQVSRFGIRRIYAAGVELGHPQNQLRTQGDKYGQHRPNGKEHARNRERCANRLHGFCTPLHAISCFVLRANANWRLTPPCADLKCI